MNKNFNEMSFDELKCYRREGLWRSLGLLLVIILVIVGMVLMEVNHVSPSNQNRFQMCIRDRTKTYGQLAQDLSCGSAQAVGQAVGRNPLTILVPCHRVMGKDGQLTGYALSLIHICAILIMYNLKFTEITPFGLSFAQSVFLLQTILFVSALIGGMTPNDYFSKLSLIKILQIDSGLLILIGICGWINGLEFISRCV